MDAANILKPALARGELRCIGATTLDEYQKYIEKDAALANSYFEKAMNTLDKLDDLDDSTKEVIRESLLDLINKIK